MHRSRFHVWVEQLAECIRPALVASSAATVMANPRGRRLPSRAPRLRY